MTQEDLAGGFNAALDQTEGARRGRMIAEVLQLRLKPNGRYDTKWGDKTALGLYNTMLRIVREGK